MLRCAEPSHRTEKVKEAYQTAAEAAAASGAPQLEPVHLAHTLLADSEGLARAAVARAAGGDANSLLRCLAKSASSLPRTSPPPASVQPSGALVKVLRSASAAAASAGDTFLSIDILFGALLEDPKVRRWCAAAAAGGGGSGAAHGRIL